MVYLTVTGTVGALLRETAFGVVTGSCVLDPVACFTCGVVFTEAVAIFLTN